MITDRVSEPSFDVIMSAFHRESRDHSYASPPVGQIVGHESRDRSENSAGSSDRGVELIFAALIGVGWLFSHFYGCGGPLRAPVAPGASLLVALISQSPFSPRGHVWNRFGLAVRKMLSRAALGIMFFVVVTPIGLIIRAMGKDPLQLKRDPRRESYWIVRHPPGPAPDSFRHLF
jgi:hypothetical protein